MEEASDGAARVDRERTKRPVWVAARDHGTRGTGIEEETEETVETVVGEGGENDRGRRRRRRKYTRNRMVTGLRFSAEWIPARMETVGNNISNDPTQS